MSAERGEVPYRKRTVRAAEIFVPEFVLSTIADHADDGASMDKEIMGLLIGRFYRDDDGTYAVVTNSITSGLIADDVSVRFDHSSLEEMFDNMDLKEGECVVGWYHSHLDIGCFMSPSDVSTQDGIFNGECGFALVIDPIKQEMKVFDSTPGDPRQIDMVVIDSD